MRNFDTLKINKKVRQIQMQSFYCRKMNSSEKFLKKEKHN